MKHSESIDKIAPALIKAQSGITGAIKDSNNPFHKTKYADLASVIDACKQHLNAAGIMFMQSPDADGPENAVSIETRLIHTSGQWFSSVCRIPLAQRDAQKVGAAITYGRRYGLQSLLGIPSEDDDGNSISAGPNPHYQPSPKMNKPKPPVLSSSTKEEKLARMLEHFAAKGIGTDKILEHVGRKSEEDITEDDIKKLRDFAKKLQPKAPEETPSPVAIESQTDKLKAMLAAKSAKS